MSGTRPPPHFRLVKPTEETDNDESIENQSREPWWWRTLVIGTLKFGRWRFSPLWPAFYVLRQLRNLNIKDAMDEINRDYGEYIRKRGWNALTLFLRIHEQAYKDPGFRLVCEKAVRKHRVSFFGLDVILNQEIQGQSPIICHLDWVAGKLKSPLPPKKSIQKEKAETPALKFAR
ncbi:MAG: hypothetical protein WCT28_01095 [Patescibacteria group bacterium]|jgi:hypothetical protein